MYVERLERLAKLLRSDADNEKGVKFDLAFWAAPSDKVTNDGARYHGLWADPDAQPTVSCGTTACAMGLAAISGEFKEEGLTFSMSRWRVAPDAWMCLPTMPSGKTGFHAAAELFDISYYEATYLFDPDKYGKPPTGAEGERRVAARIDQFISTGGHDEEDEPDDYDPEDSED